jgi:4-alpha-glucanotransferase
VTITTHDLPTFVGFWTNEDMEIRKKAGLFKNPEAEVEVAKERKADKEKLTALWKELSLLHAGHTGEVEASKSVSGELHNAVVGVLAMTPCKLFVLSQEDLLKDVNQQNMPGTTHEYPNWSLKMKYSMEELFENNEAKAFSNMFRQWIHKSGRGNLHKKEDV